MPTRYRRKTAGSFLLKYDDMMVTRKYVIVRFSHNTTSELVV
jgi:hypothetical protein